MSAGVHPSLSLHDALFPIRADRIRDPRGPLHIVEERIRSRRSSGSRPIEILSPRSATFEQFLLEGRHYLTFINERSRVEPISFLALELQKKDPKVAPGSHPLAPLLTCESNCNQRGECVHGKCKCAPGFTGNSCEEAICPVVCSGNGVFSGGICVCKQGKGFFERFTKNLRFQKILKIWTEKNFFWIFLFLKKIFFPNFQNFHS